MRTASRLDPNPNASSLKVHAWLTRASGDDVDLPVAGMSAGMCAERGLAGLAAEGAYP